MELLVLDKKYEKLQELIDNKEDSLKMWNWFEENMADCGLYFGDAVHSDFLEKMNDNQIEKCYKDLIENNIKKETVEVKKKMANNRR
jgi:hypothetical protein